MSPKNVKSKGGQRAKSTSARQLSFSLNSAERTAIQDLHELDHRTKRKLAAEASDSPRFSKNELSRILQSLLDRHSSDPDIPDGVFEPLRERLVDALEQDNPEAFGGEYLRALDGDSRRVDKLFFQFRIQLLDTEPAIWRRIQIADGTLSDLHFAIQGAFAWEESHLHEFQVGGLRFAPPPPQEFSLDFGPLAKDEDDVLISQLLPSSGKQTVWRYTYDFGDDWRHEVLFEGCGPMAPRTKYPVCVEGQRAAPPEDCGGPWAFAELVWLLAHPKEAANDERLEWLEPFDPAKFDAKKATRKMRQWTSGEE